MTLQAIAKSPYTHHVAMAGGAYAIGAKLLKDSLLARNLSIATIGVCLIQQLILRSDVSFEKKFTACSFVSLAAFGFIAYQKATTPVVLLSLGLYVLNLHSLGINNSYNFSSKVPQDRGIWYLNDIFRNEKINSSNPLIDKINLILIVFFGTISVLLFKSTIAKPLALPMYTLAKQSTALLRIAQFFIPNAPKPSLIENENKKLFAYVQRTIEQKGSDKLKNMPLLILYDDGTKSAEDIIENSSMAQISDDQDFIVLFATTREYEFKKGSDKPANQVFDACLEIIGKTLIHKFDACLDIIKRTPIHHKFAWPLLNEDWTADNLVKTLISSIK